MLNMGGGGGGGYEAKMFSLTCAKAFLLSQKSKTNLTMCWKVLLCIKASFPGKSMNVCYDVKRGGRGLIMSQ